MSSRFWALSPPPSSVNATIIDEDSLFNFADYRINTQQHGAQSGRITLAYQRAADPAFILLIND
jgi:hypothetical protein